MKKTRILYLLFLLVHFTACEERSSSVGDNLPQGESVTVSLAVDFAGEEDGTLLQPQTRAGYTVPDALYELHILQFDRDGNQLDANGSASGNVFYVSKATLGSHLTFSLTKNDDCQLVIIARGEGNTTPAIDGNLADVRKLSMEQSLFDGSNIPASGASQAQINKMPYVLHLAHVKVDEGGVAQSTVNGTEDVRLRLKRLAVKLTATWAYSVKDYNLKQILLQSVPLNFAFIPAPDATDGTYPSLLDQFTTISVPAVTNSGTHSFWIPANVRGESTSATSLKLRTRSTAPTGSCFLNFVAVNSTDSKKKLDYRVYLGDDKPTDFNLKSNTDYNYVIDFNHFGIPTDDQRVTYIDPIPASDSNENLVSTANCFMVTPGGSFCFDPFLFGQDGNDVKNTTLEGWAQSTGGIKYVKLLWQTKENGDIGEPVLGVTNSTDDHSNIVDVRRTDGNTITAVPAIAAGQCRIYCRVAANTAGGNGVIAAYDASDKILWSWHIWVTDYNPDPTGDATVDEPLKRKQKYTFNGSNQLPMMDRNLGAMAGYTNVPDDPLAMSKANGFHYQWGRKEPFLSSYSSDAIGKVNNIDSSSPVKGMLNKYGPDGISFLPNPGKAATGTTMRTGIQNPTLFYQDKTPAWMASDNWGTSGSKTIYDPCPARWRVASNSNYDALRLSTSIGSGYYTANSLTANPLAAGGFVLFFEAEKAGRSSYYRMPGYRVTVERFDYIGTWGFVWTRTNSDGKQAYAFNVRGLENPKGVAMRAMDKGDAHNVRCIQERAN